jgi:hypothetical protein
MPRKKAESETPKDGEQLELIDVAPENSKKIIAVAKRYKTALAERMAALVEEKAEKQKLLALVKEADLQPLEDGSIRFRVDGMTISITPRDELIKVKEDGDNE